MLRPGRFLVLAMLVLAAGGCMRTAAPQGGLIGALNANRTAAPSAAPSTQYAAAPTPQYAAAAPQYAAPPAPQYVAPRSDLDSLYYDHATRPPQGGLIGALNANRAAAPSAAPSAQYAAAPTPQYAPAPTPQYAAAPAPQYAAPPQSGLIGFLNAKRAAAPAVAPAPAPQYAAAPSPQYAAAPRPDLDSIYYAHAARSQVVRAPAAAAPPTTPPAAPSAAPRSGPSPFLAALFAGTRPAPVVAVPPAAAAAHAADVRVPVAPAPVAVAAPAPAPVAVVGSAPLPPYTLDTGDRLRIVVYGQEGLSNSYIVDAAGNITMPLIGAVAARGLTTAQLIRAITEKLRSGGFIREPHVALEVELYRPFFILGEVTAPGQYPYVPNMTIETAVAIAGGFTPRAYRFDVKIDRPVPGGGVRTRASVPLLTRVEPGDTIVIKERWF